MLAAYVNPRTTRLARVVERNQGLELSGRATFVTREFDSFETILHRYLRAQENRGSSICMAVAGPVTPVAAPSRVLPWSIDAQKLAERFSFQTVRMYNEQMATARGIFELHPGDLFTISHEAAPKRGNMALMIVDDALEEVLTVHHDGHYAIFPTEGGNTGFGPSTQQEAELWQFLYTQRDFISVSDIVSSGGLIRVYEFFLESRGLTAPSWYTASEDRSTRIVEQALSGDDAQAVAAVDLLVDCFAGEAANLALRGMTTGGLYLAGRLTTELIPSLDKGQFLDNFLKRGAGEERLREIPVHVIMDRNAAMLGAARMALESGVGA